LSIELAAADRLAVRQLLQAADGGSKEALDRLFDLLYEKLRAMSHHLLRAHVRHETLSTTAVVHETYLKLARDAGWTGRDREHFLSIAARAMRQIVVDAARERSAAKRGGGRAPVALSGQEPDPGATAEGVLAFDRAIAALARIDPELERLVELRYFGGLTLEEIRELTGTPERTLKRRFRSARALLVDALGLAGRPAGPLPEPSIDR
jgi:RNA polymerase sigma factor (TIGR02999 family)